MLNLGADTIAVARDRRDNSTGSATGIGTFSGEGAGGKVSSSAASEVSGGPGARRAKVVSDAGWVASGAVASAGG
ncbi:MAG: hypothetical protein KY475_22770, partial [Planctomycetes bacterium]|nr:hypothetical protein [Planctomycetota bacterium]